MKKILLSAAFGAISLGTFAQMSEHPIEVVASNFTILPARFTIDKTPYLIMKGDDGTTETFSIYDANLNLVKNISHNLTHYKTEQVTYNREHTIDDKGNVLTGEWTETYRDGYSTSSNSEYPELLLSDGSFSDAYIFATQTLFNNDEKYEYILPIYEPTSYSIEEDPYNIGVATRKTEYHDVKLIGFKVVSEDNNEIARIIPENAENFYLECIIETWNKTCYLVVSTHTDEVSRSFFYAINKETSSISEAPVRMAMSVRPTVAKKNEVINVTLPEDSKASQLMVTSAAGQTIRRIPLKAGVSSYQVRTTGLASGMYVISVDEGGTKKEYCKVVIR